MKKYYADINLYFDDMKYGIVGDTSSNRQEMIDMIKNFAKELGLTCNTKTKKLFDKNGKEVGTYVLSSQTF